MNAVTAEYAAVGSCKVLGARIADIVFRRVQAAPIGGSFNTTRIDRNQFMADAAASGLGQQLLNDLFRLFVFALAELMMSNTPLRIDGIEGRPILIVESAPYRMGAIDRVRIIHPHLLRASSSAIDLVLKCELIPLDADYPQSLGLVF